MYEKMTKCIAKHMIMSQVMEFTNVWLTDVIDVVNSSGTNLKWQYDSMWYLLTTTCVTMSKVLTLNVCFWNSNYGEKVYDHMTIWTTTCMTIFKTMCCTDVIRKHVW